MMLERLLVGLDAIGLERRQAMELAKTITMDSCPPLRVKTFNLLQEAEKDTAALGERTTRQIALDLRLPTVTARRVLEELAAQGLAIRRREAPKKKTRIRTGQKRTRKSRAARTIGAPTRIGGPRGNPLGGLSEKTREEGEKRVIFSLLYAYVNTHF